MKVHRVVFLLLLLAALPSWAQSTDLAVVIDGGGSQPWAMNRADTPAVVVTDLPSLSAFGIADLTEGDVVDPGGSGILRFSVQNDGAEAVNVVLRAVLPEGGTFTGVNFTDALFCTSSATEVTCRIPSLRQHGDQQFNVGFLAPDELDGRKFPFVVSVTADGEDATPDDNTYRGEVQLRRTFVVNNASDGGPGSLRQAMLDSRVFCLDVPCLIDVRSESPLVIQPVTPLPELRGRIKLQGSAARTTLDGSKLMDGGAVRYENGCEFRVNRFVIRNFLGHAIEAHQNEEARSVCFDTPFLTPGSITNNVLEGNLRGIVTKGLSTIIVGNVIRDHIRAGIFADGAFYTEIAQNQITGNGASGIFIRPANFGGFLPPGGDIFENTIRGNREWGIARTANGSVYIYRNTIAGNNLYGIDTGLDLDSPGDPLKPALFSAAYQPGLDATLVRGHVEPLSDGGPGWIQLYVSSSLSVWGYPEAEHQLNEYFVTGDFEISVPGDLRGKWITATGTRTTGVLFSRPVKGKTPQADARLQSSNTSELSNAVKVR